MAADRQNCGRKIRRRASAVIVLVIAGAACNLGLAWLGQWLEARPWSTDRLRTPSGTYYRTTEANWHDPVPADWPRPHEEHGYVSWLEEQRFTSSGAGTILPPGVMLSSGGMPVVEQAYFAAGWPMRTVHWSANLDNRAVPRGMATATDYEGNVSWPSWLSGHARGGSFAIRPIWPGFVVNTLFYAVLVAIGYLTLRRAIRAFRLARRLCPTCAYPIGASRICTECGEPLPTPRIQ